MARKPKRGDRDVGDEIEAHLRIEEDRLVEEGMDRDQARAAAGTVTSRWNPAHLPEPSC